MADDGYVYPIGPGLNFAGGDQGVDYTGAGDVYAIGGGVVTRLETTGSGWPGQGALLVYELTSGPRAGSYVYIAEDFNIDPSLRVGSQLTPGQLVGHASGSGLAPGIETGWADPQGHAFGPVVHSWTTWSRDFYNFIQSLLGGGGRQVGSTSPVASSVADGGSSSGSSGSNVASSSGGGGILGDAASLAESFAGSLGAGIYGALKEAAIRFAEFMIGLILLYLGIRGLLQAATPGARVAPLRPA